VKWSSVHAADSQFDLGFLARLGGDHCVLDRKKADFTTKASKHQSQSKRGCGGTLDRDGDS
jgi:hypothetical protein